MFFLMELKDDSVRPPTLGQWYLLRDAPEWVTEMQIDARFIFQHVRVNLQLVPQGQC